MSASTLTAFQQRLLVLLAHVRPRWRLTGGGALAGFHACHRQTRDLDLFWPHIESFADVIAKAEQALRDAGLRVDGVQTSRAFARRLVSDGVQTCVVDLVSDPTVVVDAPVELRLEQTFVLVDTPQEILTNKLCALLSRSELRDLIDARWLLEHGADLHRAVRDAQDKDGGFSTAVLAWTLHGTNLDALGRAAGAPHVVVEDLGRWRDAFVATLLVLSAPYSSGRGPR
jgi:hypothetical protein